MAGWWMQSRALAANIERYCGFQAMGKGQVRVLWICIMLMSLRMPKTAPRTLALVVFEERSGFLVGGQGYDQSHLTAQWT